MNELEKLGDPKKLFQYLVTTIGLFIAMITLFIFTMDEELKIFFYILLVMLVLFLLLLMYVSPIIFGEVNIEKTEDIAENKDNDNKLKKE